MVVAGALVAAGAAMMLAKGLLLITTGHDRSLVPWFSLLSSCGLVLVAVALWRRVERLRWLVLVGGLGAVVGVSSSVVAVGYLIGGTIPESPEAPSLVGASYGVMSGGVFVAVLALGLVIAVNSALAGWWRWFPVGLVVAQLPIFIIAGAVGDGVGSEELTDGLGLALTGTAWIVLGYAFAEKAQLDVATLRT